MSARSGFVDRVWRGADKAKRLLLGRSSFSACISWGD